jgi:hypothetical protein
MPGSDSQQKHRQMQHKTAKQSPDEANAIYTLPRRFVVVVTVRPCHHRCKCPLLSRHPRCLSSTNLSISSSSTFSAWLQKRTHARSPCSETKPANLPQNKEATSNCSTLTPCTLPRQTLGTIVHQLYFLLQRMTCIPCLTY